MSERRLLAARREHTTQKLRISGQRTVYISVHDDEQPAEMFLRVKGPGCTSEVIALFDIVARLASLALQYGSPLEKVADMLHATKFEPAGPVSGHERIKHCSSLPDVIGRYLLLEYCGREEVAHIERPG
jgi:ribonucleoside-diphosphate reductase alpha chain